MLHEQLRLGASLKKLEKDGCLVDYATVDWKGRNLLFHVRHKEDVTTLVKNGVDLEQRSSSGKTPLLHALRKGRNQTFVVPMIDLGAKTDVVDNHGNNIWHHTAFLIQPGDKFCERLTSLKVPGINSPNKQGLTPLALAASLDIPDATRKLVECGAKIPLLLDDKHPIALAAANSHSSFVLAFLVRKWLALKKADEELPVLASSSLPPPPVAASSVPPEVASSSLPHPDVVPSAAAETRSTLPPYLPAIFPGGLEGFIQRIEKLAGMENSLNSLDPEQKAAIATFYQAFSLVAATSGFPTHITVEKAASAEEPLVRLVDPCTLPDCPAHGNLTKPPASACFATPKDDDPATLQFSFPGRTFYLCKETKKAFVVHHEDGKITDVKSNFNICKKCVEFLLKHNVRPAGSKKVGWSNVGSGHCGCAVTPGNFNFSHGENEVLSIRKSFCEACINDIFAKANQSNKPA